MAAVQELAERVKGDDKFYVDTDAGADEQTADGSEAKPFKTLAYAYIHNTGRPTAQYLTRAFLTGAKGYAADENGVVYANAMKRFVIAAVKDQLGIDYEPDIDDGSDPNEPPWPLFQAPRRLPRIVIQPVTLTSGKVVLRQILTGDTVEIDLAAGTQVKEVPYGYYGLTLPGQPEQKIVAAWEEKIVRV